MGKLNIFDKTVSYFSPSYEFHTSRLRGASAVLNNNTYDMNTPTINYDVGSPTTTDDDMQNSETMRDTARQKVKNNGFAKGILRCAKDHAIGTGLRAKSTINRRRVSGLSEDRIKQIENDLDDYFNDWAESQFSDVTGLNNFYLQQRLAYYTYKLDGECFGSLPIVDNELSLKLIGAEFIEGDSDGFSFGIKTDGNQKPIAYNVKSLDNEFKEIKNDSIKINMIHLFNRERIDMLRGFPFLTEIMRDLDYIDQYMKTELKAAELAAHFIGSIETEATGNIFKVPDVDLSGVGSSNPSIDNTKKVFRNNTITQLQKGEKLNIFTQGRDNPNFDKIVSTSLKKVSALTRIPMELILTIFTSSYSASRASMLLMEKFTSPERMIFNKMFNNPIRNQVIEWGVLNNRLNIPNFFDNKNEILRCEWSGDAMGSVDPVKDAKAKISLIESNLTTRTKATRDLGQGDFEINVKQIEKENIALKEANLLKEVEDDNNQNR